MRTHIVRKSCLQPEHRIKLENENRLREIEILKLKYSHIEIRYRPDQPRDDHGRWVSEGGSLAGLTDSNNSGNINIENQPVIIGMQFFANRNIPKMSDRELQKSINSWNKRIEEHKMKISNPEKHCEKWDEFDVRYQRGLIHHWNREIITMNNDINAAQEELKRRKDNE